MKNKIILSLLGFFMIAGGFDEGCEEEEPKPDYITVNITLQGWLNEADSSRNLAMFRGLQESSS